MLRLCLEIINYFFVQLKKIFFQKKLWEEKNGIKISQNEKERRFFLR